MSKRSRTLKSSPSRNAEPSLASVIAVYAKLVRQWSAFSTMTLSAHLLGLQVSLMPFNVPMLSVSPAPQSFPMSTGSTARFFAGGDYGHSTTGPSSTIQMSLDT